MRQPIRFYYNDNHGITPEQIETYVSKYGKDILIGLDGIEDGPDEDVLASLDSIRQQGCLLHIYTVGCAMAEWSSEEAQQLKNHAESVGIDTSDDNWHDEWIASGWLKKAHEQFIQFNEMSAYSCEIDNLDQVLDNDPDKTVNFYKEFSQWRTDNNISTKIMMKNHNEECLTAIIEAVKNKELPVDMFAIFSMFEEGTGDAQEQINKCKELGIYAVTPKSGITPTESYGVVEEGVPIINKESN